MSTLSSRHSSAPCVSLFRKMTVYLPIVILNGLLLLLNAAPVYWQLLQGNSGPVSMGIWIMIANLNTLINCTLWYSDVANRAPIFCDISIKIRLAGEIGMLASDLCIARFLADIVSPRATAITRQDRRKRAIFDYGLSFGVPALSMACSILYQPTRFAIVRGVGCTITSVMSWPTLILRNIWPPVFSALAVLYSTYTIYRLIRHRRNFQRVISGSHSALTTSRFIRLASLSFGYLVIGVPLCIYTTIANIKSSARYLEYSYQYIHSFWSVQPISYVPIMPPPGFGGWSDIIVGALFFAAFGFGAEAMSMYSRGFRFLGISRVLPFRSRGQEVAQIKSTAPVGSLELGESWRYGQSKPFHVNYADADRAHGDSGVKVLVEQEQNIV